MPLPTMTYLYETIPVLEGDPVDHFEIEQSTSDLPLTKHPLTGFPIRRVILGGWGLPTEKLAMPKTCCTPGSGCC